MKPAPFAYVRPQTVEDAIAAFAGSEDAAIIAGGQSLLPMLNLRVTAVETLIDISRLRQLKGVQQVDGTLSLGALVTHAELEDGIGRDLFRGLLQRIASKIAYRAVRNMGTLGGSLSLCDPAADWPVCMLALDATAVVASAAGERQVPLADFLLDAYTTALEPGELLTRIVLPERPGCEWGVSKVARKSGAFADSLAIAVLRHGDLPARVALGGTASCARLLARTSTLIDDEPDVGADRLDEAIQADVAEAHEDATAYQTRCHIHTVGIAIREAGAWSK